MFSKKTRKLLRELALIAYEKDLTLSIDELYSDMNEWKKGNMTVWDIEKNIHVFHNKTARDLYRSYALSDPLFAVSIGVSKGVISLLEVPEDAREQVHKITGE